MPGRATGCHGTRGTNKTRSRRVNECLRDGEMCRRASNTKRSSQRAAACLQLLAGAGGRDPIKEEVSHAGACCSCWCWPLAVRTEGGQPTMFFGIVHIRSERTATRGHVRRRGVIVPAERCWSRRMCINAYCRRHARGSGDGRRRDSLDASAAAARMRCGSVGLETPGHSKLPHTALNALSSHHQCHLTISAALHWYRYHTHPLLRLSLPLATHIRRALTHAGRCSDCTKLNCIISALGCLVELATRLCHS